jgi:hypothetical protein
MESWILLIATQPTGNAAVRMRVWRDVRALGAAILRDGVYLLPSAAPLRSRFDALAQLVSGAGGTAYVVAVAGDSRDAAGWPALFDRSADYGELLKAVQAAARRTPRSPIDELRTRARELESEYVALADVDYFPGAAQAQVRKALDDFRHGVEQRASPGEPMQQAGRRIEPRDPARYQGRQWATRKGLWIDRVASAWLVRRFVDRDATFLWLDRLEDKPKRAIGFDYDGADFTHTDGRVTFEVIAASFGLQQDPALVRIGSLVHVLDAGGASIDEAAGIEAVFGGLRRRHATDEAFLAACSDVLDGLHLVFSAATDGEEARR